MHDRANLVCEYLDFVRESMSTTQSVKARLAYYSKRLGLGVANDIPSSCMKLDKQHVKGDLEEVVSDETIPDKATLVTETVKTPDVHDPELDIDELVHSSICEVLDSN